VRWHFVENSRAPESALAQRRRVLAGHHEPAAEASSLKKGESLLDTIHTLSAMKPDILVMRHASSARAILVARHLDIRWSTPATARHEHPRRLLTRSPFVNARAPSRI